MKERKGAEKRGGDQRCLDLVRWRSALFGLGERKKMEGWRGRENRVSGYWGRVMEKKKKKGEKGIFGEREDTRV